MVHCIYVFVLFILHFLCFAMVKEYRSLYTVEYCTSICFSCVLKWLKNCVVTYRIVVLYNV